MKVYIESAGCYSNLADTNQIREYILFNKGELVNNPKKADFIIFMSCGFNNLILQDNFKRLIELKNNKAKILLGGCIPHINKEIPSFIDFSFGPREMEKLDQIFKFKLSINKFSSQFNVAGRRKVIRISTGCDGACSYCAIKLANGTTKSHKIKDIRRVIFSGLKEGYSKFLLTSEDVGSWGKDIHKNIVDLIQNLIKIQGNFKIQITTLNPKWFIKFPQLIDIFKSEKIEKRIYLSLQSGSDRILKLMNREYSSSEYFRMFNLLKKKIPSIKIQSDIIIGFPTESKNDFQKTLNMVNLLDIHFLQVFAYTAMKNTPAFNFNPKVQFKVIKSRVKKVILDFLKKNKSAKRKLVNTNIKDFEDIIS